MTPLSRRRFARLWLVVLLTGLLPVLPPSLASHAAPSILPPAGAAERRVTPQAVPAPLLFPSEPAASRLFDLNGTWQTMAWSNVKPAPGAPHFVDSGYITFVQNGTTLTGSFTVTTHTPPSQGTLSGTINEQGVVAFSYTVTAGSPIYVGRTQNVTAKVTNGGTFISGDWTESTGYAGAYYAFNHGVTPRPIEQSFGNPDDVCGHTHTNACGQALDPVNMATGNAVWQETDLSLMAPGIPLRWWRTYNSRSVRSGVLGRAWSTALDVRLLVDPTGATLVAENGAESRFRRSGAVFVAPQGELARLKTGPNSTYRITRPDNSTLVFNGAGQLLTYFDAAGQGLTLSYTNGVLASIRDAANHSVTLTTNPQGRITKITDPSLNRTVVYTYTSDILTAVQDVRGQVAHYGYTSGYLTTVTNPDQSIQVENRYDASGRVIWQHELGTAPVTVTYDLVVAPLTQTLTLTTSASGALTGPVQVTISVPVKRTQVQTSLNALYSYDHDAAGRLLRFVDAAGNKTITFYNANDQRSEQINALGATQRVEYDANGNLLLEHNALNATGEAAFDSQNRLVAERDALGQVTNYTYSPYGLLTTATDAVGATSRYTYTTFTRSNGITQTLLTSDQDARGNVTSYTYNPQGQRISVTDSRLQTTLFAYDAAGRQIETTNPAGVKTCWAYNAADQVVAQIEHCRPGFPDTAVQNIRTTYGYDALGRQLWTKNPRGEVTVNTFNAANQLAAMTIGCTHTGLPSTTICDAYTSLAPERNRRTSFTYDPLGRPVQVTNVLGIVARTEYDLLGRPWRTTQNYQPGVPASDSVNVISTVEYDALGRTTAQINASGQRTVTQYDAADQVIATITNYQDGNPTTGSAEYDIIERYAYNLAGSQTVRIKNYVDGVWNPAKPTEDIRTVSQYDSLQRLAATISSYVDGVAGVNETDTDRITEYRYDATGNQVAMLDPLGRVTAMTYDGQNRPLTTIQVCTNGQGMPLLASCAATHGPNNDQNLKSTTHYDSNGRVDWQEDTAGRRSRVVYDALGRMVQRIQNADGTGVPGNITTTFAYDAMGATTAVTNTLNQRQQMSYNLAGWQVTATDATNRTTTQTFDGLGRVVAVVDPLNHRTVTEYDPLGRMIRTIKNYQDGVVSGQDGSDQDSITAISYDALGNRLAVVQPDGIQTQFQYNSLNQLIRTTDNAKGQLAPTDVATMYGYNRLGQLIQTTNPRNAISTRSYNSAGWMISETDAQQRTYTTTYNRLGQRVQTADARPAAVTYSYDLANRLTGIAGSDGVAVSMQYDSLGRRTQLVDASGTTTFTYNDLDLPLSSAHSVAGTVSYTYNALGQRTGLNATPDMPTQSYAYDAAGRLQSVQVAGQSYATAQYDPAGRLQSLNRANGTLITYAYDGLNRVTSEQAVQNTTTLATFTYTLNRAGQLTATQESSNGSRATTKFYAYDGLHRLTQTQEPGTTTGYAYDLAGNRTAVTVNGQTTSRSYTLADEVVGWSYDAAGNLLQDTTQQYVFNSLNQLASTTVSGQTTSYVYNGDGMLARTGASGLITNHVLDLFAELPETLGRRSTNGAVSEWWIRGWGAELGHSDHGTMQGYIVDRLGSIRLRQTATGAIDGSWKYDAYGQNKQAATSQSMGWTGEYQEPANQLVYLRARWYHTGQGRFLSRDSVLGSPTDPQTLHRTAYSQNDPLNRVDPTGNTSRQCHTQQPGRAAPGAAKSDCERMIDHISSVVKLSKPDLLATAGYFALTLGRDLWSDVVATYLAADFSNINIVTMVAGIIGGAPGTIVAALVEGFLTKFAGSKGAIEQYPFNWVDRDGNTWWGDGGYNPCITNGPHTGKKALCGQLLNTLLPGEQIVPPVHEQLRYGFKPDYYHNSHHFMAFFAFGYTGGAFAGIGLSEFWEYQTSNNPVDVKIGNRGAEIGGRFGGVGFITLPEIGGIQQTIGNLVGVKTHPSDLPHIFATEMCLP